MLTPAFSLKQDDTFLTILVKAPFAKISETEIFVEGNDFKFYSKPYFLRLTLPGNIVEDGREKADYNTDNGEFTLVFAKETAGEHFDGLDMLTKLLAPKGSTSATGPLIQVIDSECGPESSECQSVDEGEAGADDSEVTEEFDWCIEQTPYTEQPVKIGAPTYGFANQKSGIFSRLQEDLVGIVDCPEPDSLPEADRRTLRLQAEHDKFDEDHYLGDLYEDEQIQAALQYAPPWQDEWKSVCNGVPVDKAVELNEEDEEVMRKLPRKEYLLDSEEDTRVYLGLLDILYAYVYNHRTCEGEYHCESGWTISKLSATLSWLDVFSSVRDVLVSCVRRSLCYPLYRHWQLNMAIKQDVVTLLKLGRRRILKCLLEVRSILMDQDSRYVLNDLYISDYCVWIQSASNQRLASLAEAIQKVALSKADVNLNLPEIEHLASAAINSEEGSVDDVTSALAGVHLQNTQTDDVISDSDDESTESEDENPDSDDKSTDSDDDKSDCEDRKDVRNNAVLNCQKDLTKQCRVIDRDQSENKSVRKTPLIHELENTEISISADKDEGERT